MKKNQYKQYIAQAGTRGHKAKAILGLFFLMALMTALFLLIESANAPAAVVTTVGLWV